MRNNVTKKHSTTLKISKTLYEICVEKEIDIQQLIRSTLHFLLSLDLSFGKEMTNVLDSIVEEYKASEKAPLSDDEVLVKTYFTERQEGAYKKIDKYSRKKVLNAIISIAINNHSYTNMAHSDYSAVTRDKIVNSFAIDFFINAHVEDFLIIKLMEDILTKTSASINKNRVLEAFYKNLYTQLFPKEEATDFINQYKLLLFIHQEFQKIYFCMLVFYNVDLSTKASKSIARKVNKEYKDVFEKKYNKDIEELIKNEINLYPESSTFDKTEQANELLGFIHLYCSTDPERKLVALCVVPHIKLLGLMWARNSAN